MLKFLVLMLCSSAAFAAPFIVGDVPDPKCNKCVWDGAGFGPLVNDMVVDTVRGNPAMGNRVCLRDASGALIGTNNITLMCRDSTSLWGDSSVVPFSFVRPASISTPTGMRVAP